MGWDLARVENRGLRERSPERCGTGSWRLSNQWSPRASRQGRIGPMAYLTRDFILTFFVVLALNGTPSPGASRTNARGASAKFLSRVHRDPLEQWMRWEQTQNEKLNRQDVRPIKVKTAWVPIDREVEILRAGKVPAVIERRFIQRGRVLVPRHPFNTSDQIPFFDEAPTETRRAHLSSSRSVLFRKGRRVLYSVKMPTDYVVKAKQTKGKLRIEEDIRSGIQRSRYVMELDAHLRAAEHFILLHEVLGIVESRSGSGVMVRDLSPLLDGNYYLPAFSIPFVGHSIAKRNGEDFEAFWGKHYLEKMGRVKAELLLRYGIRLENPHAQNMLIQLDRNLKPTGKIVLRDLSDTQLVEPVARALGQEAALEADAKLGFPGSADIQPFLNGYSTAGFGMSEELLLRWREVETKASFEELSLHLRLRFEHPEWTQAQAQLFAPSGVAAIRRLHVDWAQSPR